MLFRRDLLPGDIMKRKAFYSLIILIICLCMSVPAAPAFCDENEITAADLSSLPADDAEAIDETADEAAYPEEPKSESEEESVIDVSMPSEEELTAVPDPEEPGETFDAGSVLPSPASGDTDLPIEETKDPVDETEAARSAAVVTAGPDSDIQPKDSPAESESEIPLQNNSEDSYTETRVNEASLSTASERISAAAKEDAPQVSGTAAGVLTSVTLKHDTLKYTGAPRTQTNSLIVKALKNGKEVVLDKSCYSVSYRGNTDVGTAELTVRGKSPYTGSLTASYEITPVRLSSATLKYKSLTFTGKHRTQTKSVKVRAAVAGIPTVLTLGKDYTVSYKNNKKVGTATMIITGTGNYAGTLTKPFKIIPKTVEIKSLPFATRKFTVTWRKPAWPASGVQVQYSTRKDFSEAEKAYVSGRTTLQKTITGLTSGKTYYVRLRTWAAVDGTNYYSEWSTPQSVRLSVNRLTVKGSAGGRRTLILDNAPAACSDIRFSVWSKQNGQDDVVWYDGRKDSSGRWTASFSVSNHRNSGAFQIYVYDGDTYLFKKAFAVSPAETATKAGRLAASLKTAKTADQLILVGAEGTSCRLTMLNKNADGTWHQLLETDGNVGLNGIGDVTEWNRKTPVGVYGFSEAFGIWPDPGTALPYTQVDDTWYWVDDVNSRYYNQFVTTRETAQDWTSAEHIIDYVNCYQYCLALDFNKECVSGAGSAIFLHAGSGEPTLGCIAVPIEQMEKIMLYVRAGCRIIIDTPEGLADY